MAGQDSAETTAPTGWTPVPTMLGIVSDAVPAPVRRQGGLPRRRRRAGLVAAAAGLPALTALLLAFRDTVTLESVLLVYLLAVVCIAVLGGVLAALMAAIAAFLLATWFFTRPYHTFEVERSETVLGLIVFVGVAVLVSITVELGARARVAAARSDLEFQTVARFTQGPLDDDSLTAVLTQVQRLFAMTTVALIRNDAGPETHATTLAHIGPPLTGPPTLTVPAGQGMSLVTQGPAPFAEDRRLLGLLAANAARAWESQQLSRQAERAAHLAEVDRVRSALLSAVGHDLRTPLAGIKAAVSSLRQDDVTWSHEEERELLATIEHSADRLSALIDNLLAMSRLQAGALSVHLEPVAVEEVAARAALQAAPVRIEVPEDLPLALADPGLLERVMVNLISNAVRFSSPQHPPHVDARIDRGTGRIEVRCVDHGPGVSPDARARMFAPFQRLGDTLPGGIGLGLAIAQGFTDAMGGTLTPSTTPGGGLTMTITLPAVDDPAGAPRRSATTQSSDDQAFSDAESATP